MASSPQIETREAGPDDAPHIAREWRGHGVGGVYHEQGWLDDRWMDVILREKLLM